jgi:metal transporter CNNM
VTLLIGNATAMEALPIFLDRLVSPYMAILLSVTMVLIFGEILPQAICAHYSLPIGAFLSRFVMVLQLLCSPIAWPVSKLLHI